MFGFENIKEFIIKDSDYKPFSIVKSINEEISFLITSPFNFLREYSPEIQEKDWLDIKAHEQNDKVMLCIIKTHMCYITQRYY